MSVIDLSIDLCSMNLRNPVMTASGTFGYGEEFCDFIDLSRLGGIVVKATTGSNRDGNAYPRMAETASGMLNAVGLQNKGVDYFTENIYPRIRDFDTNVIVNVSGSTLDEYVEVAEKLSHLTNIPAIELNISCPNVKQGGMAFGTNPQVAAEVTKAVKQAWGKILIVKLSPNVTSITDIAQAVKEAGADAVSLINTLRGMAIDSEKRKPILSTITGGLSEPAIKPIALRMVWEVSKKVKIPIIGIGGIASASDAIEFLLAGATAIQVGTANFLDPQITVKIVDGIEDYLRRHKFTSVGDIVGLIK